MKLVSQMCHEDVNLIRRVMENESLKTPNHVQNWLNEENNKKRPPWKDKVWLNEFIERKSDFRRSQRIIR